MSTTSEALEAFIDRMTPPFMRPNADLPPSWSGSIEEWRELCSYVREQYRERLTREFVEGIARGWRPEELVAGGFDPRSGRGLSLTGQVVSGQGKISSTAWAQMQEWDRDHQELIESARKNA